MVKCKVKFVRKLPKLFGFLSLCPGWGRTGVLDSAVNKRPDTGHKRKTSEVENCSAKCERCCCQWKTIGNIQLRLIIPPQERKRERATEASAATIFGEPAHPCAGANCLHFKYLFILHASFSAVQGGQRVV